MTEVCVHPSAIALGIELPRRSVRSQGVKIAMTDTGGVVGCSTDVERVESRFGRLGVTWFRTTRGGTRRRAARVGTGLAAISTLTTRSQELDSTLHARLRVARDL
jgi:hypothetical protein